MTYLRIYHINENLYVARRYLPKYTSRWASLGGDELSRRKFYAYIIGQAEGCELNYNDLRMFITNETLLQNDKYWRLVNLNDTAHVSDIVSAALSGRRTIERINFMKRYMKLYNVHVKVQFGKDGVPKFTEQKYDGTIKYLFPTELMIWFNYILFQRDTLYEDIALTMLRDDNDKKYLNIYLHDLSHPITIDVRDGECLDFTIYDQIYGAVIT